MALQGSGLVARFCDLLVVIIVNDTSRSRVFSICEVGLAAEMLLLNNSYLVLALLQKCYIVFHQAQQLVLVFHLVLILDVHFYTPDIVIVLLNAATAGNDHSHVYLFYFIFLGVVPITPQCRIVLSFLDVVVVRYIQFGDRFCLIDGFAQA